MIPEKMLAWPLFGSGMNKLGRNDEPCLVNIPGIGEDELLVKIEAVGLCFSDVKLIRAGEGHPRVVSENLEKDPVIPGHEAVMSVVKVGKSLEGQFSEGQKFIIQADIYVNGKGFAYGYAIDGGMAQYSRIDQRVLNGDEGCYLLPIKEDTPVAVAALMEPWTCVKASYMIDNRTVPLKGGSVLIAASGGNAEIYKAGELLKNNPAAEITVSNLSGEAIETLKNELPEARIEKAGSLDGKAFDDIFICDVTDPGEACSLAKLCKRGAVVSFIGETPDGEGDFDAGSIHYEGWFYQGTESRNFSEAYGRNVRSRVKKGGTCWLPGGAGAMGQMHTQLAVESPEGPSRILVTDMDNARIENVKQLLADKIKERNIEFKAMNPADFDGPADFDKAVREFAPEGFDDIIMLVPVIPVLNASAKHLGRNGVMNIFAGIPAGKEGSLNIKDIARGGIRYIGSSGSRTEHLRQTLELAESGTLNPVTALAAIGGMKVLKKGLQAVIDAEFPGKTVIFPNCEDMPLTPVQDIPGLGENLDETLSADGFYTKKTEEKLFEKFSR
jgi:threonine dehydrogenase-like Zn-dependent dehydrogenase